MNKILTLVDKGVNSTSTTPGGILAKLFRQILFDLDISLSAYSSLMTRFINEPMNRIPDNRADRASAVGNFNKEFAKPELTWKKLIEAQKLLQFEDVELTVRGYNRIKGRITEHTVRYSLGPSDIQEIIDEEVQDGQKGEDGNE